ncbi:MAG: hypothetical protein K2Y22_01305 [Candidatus Obscuribacterales bacterium]|nr:hypothetical protein [Candidatus Obscuribacterales bacterium]
MAEKKKPEGAAADAVQPTEHYEEVAEYRIGEGPPPLFLIVAFAIIVIWASISWIPFFGY